MSLLEKITKFKEEQSMSSRYNCPYCTKEVNLSFVKTTDDSFESVRVQLRKAICPNCKKLIIEAGFLKIEMKQEWRGGRGSKLVVTELPIEYQIIYPINKIICNDKRVPEQLRDGLNQAYSVLDCSSAAAAGMARRALEHFIVIQYSSVVKKGSNLFEKIQSIEWPEGIKPKVLDAIRLCGNYALHPEKELEITKEEALFVIIKTKELYEFVYIESIEEAKMIDQIKQKSLKNKKQI